MNRIFYPLIFFINHLSGNEYNVEIFVSNGLFLILCFILHFYTYINSYKKYNIYKKYKTIISIHILLYYIISIILCSLFVTLVYCNNDILWNIILCPFISFILVTSLDNYIIRKIDRKYYDNIRKREYNIYVNSLNKLIEAQNIQQSIIDIHNTELYELKKNISIVKDMMSYSDIEEDRETDFKVDAQDGN